MWFSVSTIPQRSKYYVGKPHQKKWPQKNPPKDSKPMTSLDCRKPRGYSLGKTNEQSRKTLSIFDREFIKPNGMDFFACRQVTIRERQVNVLQPKQKNSSRSPSPMLLKNNLQTENTTTNKEPKAPVSRGPTFHRKNFAGYAHKNK